MAEVTDMTNILDGETLTQGGERIQFIATGGTVTILQELNAVQGPVSVGTVDADTGKKESFTPGTLSFTVPVGAHLSAGYVPQGE